MGLGLLRSLLKNRNRQGYKSRFAKLPARSGRPFLESLETRALLSILVPNPGLTGPAEQAGSGLPSDTSLIHLLDPQGGQQPDQNDGSGQNDGSTGQNDGSGQDNGPGDDQSGNKHPSAKTLADTLLGVQSNQLNVQLLPRGNGPGGQQQGQGGTGQNSPQSDNSGGLGGNQAGGSSGQSGSGNNGQTDSPSGAPVDGPSGPDDGSDATQGSSQIIAQGGDGDNAPPSGIVSGTNASADISRGTRASPADLTEQDRPDISGNDPSAPFHTGQDAKTNSTAAVSGIGTGDDLSTPSNGQGGVPDRKQHGSGSGSFSEGDQRNLVGVQEAKQHGPDGIVISGEELHMFVSAGSQEPEPNNRIQVAAPNPQQNGLTEEPGQRPVEEHVPLAEVLQRLALEEEARYSATEGIVTSAVAYLGEPTIGENSYPNVAPQNHGLLIDSLALDFASLRTEVRSFFDLMDNLGGHPTEKQIGVLLSSAAVVVAAAMTCEVARRQARRQAPGPSAALVPRLELANEADAPSSLSLPNFGQFSAWR